MSINPSSIEIMLLTCAGLSITGASFIILSSLLYKKLQSYTFRLVTYLAVADFIASLSYFLSDSLIHKCLPQALLQNYGQMASIIITGVISYSIYEMIVKNNLSIKEKEKRFVVISFGVPLILTPLPLITDSYGDNKGWCWIKFDKGIEIFWIFLEFYGFFLVFIVLNIFFYSKIYKVLKKNQCFIKDTEKVQKLMNRIKWYPIILLICFVPSLFHRLYYIDNQNESIELNLIAGALNALNGFFNAVMYGMTSKVRNVYRRAFKKLTMRKISDCSTN